MNKFKLWILKKRIAIGERQIEKEMAHVVKCFKYIKEQMKLLDALKMDLELKYNVKVEVFDLNLEDIFLSYHSNSEIGGNKWITG